MPNKKEKSNEIYNHNFYGMERIKNPRIVLYEIEPVKTYATRENAVKAIERIFEKYEGETLRFSILTHKDGRFFPVFIGMNAIKAGVHFHFNVIA